MSAPRTKALTRTRPIFTQTESRTARLTRSWICGTTGPTVGRTRMAFATARSKWFDSSASAPITLATQSST